jgi:hypothetical protein
MDSNLPLIILVKISDVCGIYYNLKWTIFIKPILEFIPLFDLFFICLYKALDLSSKAIKKSYWMLALSKQLPFATIHVLHYLTVQATVSDLQ